MFKTLFTILIVLTSVESFYINADDDYVSYCIEKYNPDSQKDEFIKCVTDLKDFNDQNNTSPSSDGNQKYDFSGLNAYDFINIPKEYFDEQTKREYSDAYDNYLKLRTVYKSYAVEINQNLALAGGYGYCHGHQEIMNDVINCALKSCNQNKSNKNNFCVTQYNDSNFVMADSVNKLRLSQAQNRYNRIDWSRAADFFAKDLKTNPAFGNTPPTRVCNFKNYEGEIITGDCKNVSIRKGNDTYWKIQ